MVQTPLDIGALLQGAVLSDAGTSMAQGGDPVPLSPSIMLGFLHHWIRVGD